MFAANAYRIRFATVEDASTLGLLAERYYQQRLVGRILIGEIDGTPAAALSLHDGRVIADSSPSTDRLVATLRMRAGAIRAFEHGGHTEAPPDFTDVHFFPLESERGIAGNDE